jgi:hypothetical protein
LLARGRDHLGGILRVLGRHAEARRQNQSAVALWGELTTAQPGDHRYWHGLARSYNNLGPGQYEQAIVCDREAIGHERAALDRLAQRTEFRRLLSNHYRNLAASLRARSQLREAADAARERDGRWPKNPTELYSAGCDLALCVSFNQNGARREAFAIEAMQTLRAAVAAGWSDAARTARNPDLAALHDRPDFRSCLDQLFDRAFPDDPFALLPKPASEVPVVRPSQ